MIFATGASPVGDSGASLTLPLTDVLPHATARPQNVNARPAGLRRSGLAHGVDELAGFQDGGFHFGDQPGHVGVQFHGCAL